MSKLRIGFMGLGTMGGGMARRLLSAGFPVTVYNRNPAKSVPFASEGATVAQTPAQAAAGNDVLIAMLADDIASRAIWLGENGALAAAKPGTILIDCSTVTIAWTRELAAAATAYNCSFLDAPVTGTKPHAANGELTFLVGGDIAILEKVRPVLVPMSKEIVHVGPSGSGAAIKLINNFMCGVEAVALAEANAMIHRAGLNPETALPILLNGAPGSPVIKMLATRHGKKDYTPNFQLRLLAKDLTYAIDEAKKLGLDLVTAKAAVGTLNAGIAQTLGEQDMASILQFLETAPRQ